MYIKKNARRKIIEKLQEKESEIQSLIEHHHEITNQIILMSQEENRLNTELIERIQIIDELREENEKLKHEARIQQHNDMIKKAEESTKRMDDFLNGQRRVINNTG